MRGNLRTVVEQPTFNQLDTNQNRVVNLFGYSIVRFFLIIWGICVIYPMFWTLYTSFKSDKEFFANAWALPKSLDFKNYLNAWTGAGTPDATNIAQDFWNTILVCVFALILSLVLTTMTSYAIARMNFKGSNALYMIYVAAMMVPSVLGLIPLYFLMNDLGLIDNLWGIGIVYAIGAVPQGVFFMVSFFQELPKELEEAAAIDGCGLFGTFFRVMLPLCKSGLITIGILNILGFWNEYFYGFIFLQSKSNYTLSVGVASLIQDLQYKTDYGALFAALVISIIPVVVLYSLFQRQIQAGLTAGSVKG